MSLSSPSYQRLADRADRSGEAAGSGGDGDSEPVSSEELNLLQCLENPETLQKASGITSITIEEPLTKAWIPGVVVRSAYIYDHSRALITAGGHKLAAIYGYKFEEITALPEGWNSLIHPEDTEKVQGSTEELISGASEIASIQMRVACKDGHWEWIQHDWRALKRDEEKRLTRAVGLVQVITPMALATQALCNEASLNSMCRLLVEEWVEGIFVIDSAWRVLYANQGALDSLGYAMVDLHGRPLQHFTTLDLGRKKTPSMPKGEQKITVRAEHVCKDGRRCPVEITLRRIAGDRLLATTRDIREQLAAEELSRRQTAYYKGLFENNPSGVAVFDNQLKITEANPALRRMLGYADRQFSQMLVPDLIEVTSRPGDHFWKELREPNSRSSSEIEATLKRRDGKLLYVHAAITFVCQTGIDESGHGIVIFTDISARKQAEQELKQQSQLNDTLVRESAAMIGMVDKDGIILKVNPAVEKTSGYTAKELVGKSMWESGLVDTEEVPQAAERLRKLAAGAPRVIATSRCRTKAGELRLLQVHNTATRQPDGQVENFIITAIDITEQQRLQHHLMEAIEQEQARIGHDLHDGVGQLLTGIGAMTEVLQMHLTGTQREDAARIHDLVRQTIHQVRQLSRNMSPAAVQNRDLSASLVLLADTVQTSFRRHCECKIDPDFKVTDPTKSTHLFRMAQEAVNNAMRHGNPNKIVLSLQKGRDGRGVLEIFNDGRSFDCRPGNEGIGLRVMQYRASLIHADFSVNCPPSGGVKVTCKFPLPKGAGSPQTNNKRQTP